MITEDDIITEDDLRVLECAAEQVCQLEADLQRQERKGRILVWVPGLVLIALASNSLYQQDAEYPLWIFYLAVSVGFSTLCPLRRKWEIDAQRARLALRKRVRDLASRLRA